MTGIAESYSILCDPMDCSLPGFSVNAILEWRIPWTSSWSRKLLDRTERLSHSLFLYHWATREALHLAKNCQTVCQSFMPIPKQLQSHQQHNKSMFVFLHQNLIIPCFNWSHLSMSVEPGGLQSMGSLRVGHDWVTSLSLFTFMHWRRRWQPTPVFLPGESQGWGSLVGCHLWGCTESDTTEATFFFF